MKRPARAALAVAAGALLALAAPVAWACPYCIGKEPTLPPTLKLVGLFLLVPFIVAGGVVLTLRHLLRSSGRD